MESAYRETILQRAAIAIEERVRAIAKASELEVIRWHWNLGHSGNAARPHRIDLCVKNAAVKIYFLDCELLSYADGKDHYQLENRLQRLVGDLNAIRNLNISE
jgi:hypothetical protein